jgi:hypothetical protein
MTDQGCLSMELPRNADTGSTVPSAMLYMEPYIAVVVTDY